MLLQGKLEPKVTLQKQTGKQFLDYKSEGNKLSWLVEDFSVEDTMDQIAAAVMVL